MQRMIVIGQSHVRALLDGYADLARAGAAGQEEVAAAFAVSRPDRTVVSTWQADRFVKDASARALPDVLDSWGPTCVVLAWGGNQMNLRALVATDRPFDVLPPSAAPADGPDPSAELIPCSVIDAFVRRRLEENDRLGDLLTACADRRLPVCVLVPPPPLPEGAVRDRLADGPHFAKVLQELGQSATEVPLVPEPVRQRLWSLMADAYRSFADDHGLDLLSPPGEAFDDRGMLAPPYWGQDPTHGNDAYGAAVLGRAFAWATGQPVASAAGN